MNKYVTEIRAIDPISGELKSWQGPHISALTWRLAEQYCQKNGLGYCKVIGELVAEIDWDGNETNYEINKTN